MGRALLLSALLSQQPASADPTPSPAQIQTANVAALKGELERTQFELIRQQNSSWWTLILTLIGGPAGAVALAKGYAAWRTQQLQLLHSQQMAAKEAEHKQSLERLRAEAEVKRESNDGDLDDIRGEFDELKKKCAEDERKCEEAICTLRTRLEAAEGKTAKLTEDLHHQREAFIILQASSRQSSFAGWTRDFDKRIIDVTPAAVRQIMVPLGKKHPHQWDAQLSDTVFPEKMVRVLDFLEEQSKVLPGHIAGVLNVKVDPRLQPMAFVKVLATFPDQRPYGVQNLAIPMSAFIDLPPGLLDDPGAPNTNDSGPPPKLLNERPEKGT